MKFAILRTTMAPTLLLAFPALASAQSDEETKDVFDRGCGDDNATDRCAEKTQAKMREMYGLQGAEELVESGTTFRRAMFVNGYGGDVVAISFERRPGQGPEVLVTTPRAADGEATKPLAATLGQDVWSRIIARSVDFDAKLAREVVPEMNGRDSVICLHGWFVVVEAGDAPRLAQNIIGQQMQPAEIRRDSESACADGLASPYAFELADIAYELLPECSTISRDRVRNVPQLLAYCHGLSGDRMAAGEAWEFTRDLASAARAPTEESLGWRFARSAFDRIPSFTALAEAGRMEFGLPQASDVDHAAVNGVITRGVDEDREAADISLELVRQAGVFRILDYEVSDFRSLD